MHPVIELGKDSLGDDVGVVAGPARNDRSQRLDQRLLARATIPSDQGPCTSQVTLLGFSTGFDQCFKAEGLSRPVLAASVSTNGILADIEAKKVASDAPLVRMEGVCEARFPWFELQANLLEPPLCLLVEGVERVEVAMEDQGVVRVSHHRRLPVEAMLAAWDTAA